MNEPSKLRLDLPLILPDVHEVDDRCVHRLIDSLKGRPGVAEAHIVPDSSQAPQLCVHYDPNVISLTRLREIVESVGAQLSDRYSHLSIWADRALDVRAARRIADQLREVKGVLEADVSGSGAVRIEYDRQLISEQALRDRATELGVRAGSAMGVLKVRCRERQYTRHTTAMTTMNMEITGTMTTRDMTMPVTSMKGRERVAMPDTTMPRASLGSAPS